MSFMFSNPEPKPLPPLPKIPKSDNEERRKRRIGLTGIESRVFTSLLGASKEPRTSKTLLGE